MLIVREFLDDGGRSPFREWLLELDQAVRAGIQARILRFELGNSAITRSRRRCLGSSPGFRSGLPGLLWAERAELVLLLLGGDKSSQRKDISCAKQYWATYLKETPHGSKK
jgi:putative addiction module killer protein